MKKRLYYAVNRRLMAYPFLQAYGADIRMHRLRPLTMVVRSSNLFDNSFNSKGSNDAITIEDVIAAREKR